MSIAVLVETLLAAGVDHATIVAAVRAVEPCDAVARKREADRIRIAEKRAASKVSQMSQESRDNATCATPSPERPSTSLPVTVEDNQNLSTPPIAPPPHAESPKRGKPADAAKRLEAWGCAPGLAADWLELRRKKRAVVNATVFDGIEREAARAGIPPGDAVRMMVERGWQGFKAEWVENGRNRARTGTTARESASAFADGWRRGIPGSTDY